ncbi:MAG: glycosyltransferase family 4 protein [Lachnospiraceae bacterium]|nr:glycosyltransferase family 4 protein [Lachnospiraceae bacterium]
MLGHKRVPSREGGVEVVVEELSVRMAERGYSVTCFNRRGCHVSGKEHGKKKCSEYKGIRLITVFTIDRKGLAAVTSSIAAAVRAALGAYEIVHFHAEGPCVMLWLPKLFGKRCVATIHGLDWQRAKWNGLAAKYIYLGEKMAVRYANEIIVLSKGMQEYFERKYGRHTVFIPNGVNRAKYREAKLIKDKWGLSPNSYLLFLGRLVPEKGIAYLIEAFQKVHTDKKLVIAGGSSDTEKYQRELWEKAKGDKRILFTDFVQGQILDELYSNAYVYILPSDLEGMPLTLLEAMSYGNCCLISDIGECTEVAEGKAVIFRHGDSKDLQEKLQMLCGHNEIVEKYRKGTAEFICSKFSWEEAVDRTLALYDMKKTDRKALLKQRDDLHDYKNDKAEGDMR